MKAIDLFAGCGGLSHGFIRAGFEITKAVEIDDEISITYKFNHPGTRVFVDDITRIDNPDYFSMGEIDVIIGGPPCQGFSMAGARIRRGFIDDPRNQLFKHYLNIVRITRPKVFIFENVKGILTLDKGRIMRSIKDEFTDPDNFNGDKYHVTTHLLNAKDFGIPQNRQRVIIIGVLNKQVDIEFLISKTIHEIQRKSPTFFSLTTVWDAISDLSDVEPITGSESIATYPETDYQRELNDSFQIFNHTSFAHNQKILDRISRVQPGQNFTVLHENIKSVHSGAYGRMEKDNVSATITTRFDTPSGGRFIHPVRDRMITMREAARIQSFPDSFRFFGSRSSICRQIGNAVPPKLAYFLGELTRRVIDDQLR